MMNKNFEKIAGKDEEFEERFGALWEGLNVNEEDGKRILVYVFFFLLRRFMLGVLTVPFRDVLFF
jgi:hypothetical protein